MITVTPSTTIAEIKEEALSALTSDVNKLEDVPKVQNGDDFDLCKALKEKGKLNGEYEVLDPDTRVRDHNMASYDTIYFQFRDPSSGELLPVTFIQPSIDDDEELKVEAEVPISSVSKGKRKAQFDD